MCYVRIGTLQRGEKTQATPTKQDIGTSWCLLGALWSVFFTWDSPREHGQIIT